MAEDRFLQCYIRNLPTPPSSLIEPYLREADFWHVAFVDRGCKLWSGGDPRCTHSIFHAASVLSFWRMCIYSWGYQWMGR
ncbi:hypothetical protein PVK06_007669 [Gossypium arboreum]|uniref:Uncharacterized protein n=1 Tax=Gossypium arboreum TaxID=29729 RepID=A0ABR0QIW5_GOSAR|nr:hypothetical protein PVK06_007669 [Gossypium arboreum]